MKYKHAMRWLLTGMVIALTGCASNKPANVSGTVHLSSDYQNAASQPATPSSPARMVEAEPEQGLGHKVLWYVPNRLLDLVDIFRFRLRAGPGLAANVRLTDYADVYIGTYYTAFVGLPGPRMQPAIRPPWGMEYEKGLKLMGVDATDDLAHEPGYSPTEFNAGLQLLILGVEIGFDPVEFGDFFSGFVMIDLRGDDR